MNATIVLSLISTAAFTAAIVVLFMRRPAITHDRSIFYPLLLSLLLYDFIVLSNFLEHAGITDYMDPAEDVAEIVFTLMFLFFINNWRKARSEARFRSLFQQAPLPLAEVDLEGRILKVNDILAEKLHEYYGITIDDIPTVGKWMDVAYPDPGYKEMVQRDWEERTRRAMESGTAMEPVERVTICKDGTARTLISTESFVGENLVVSLVDITDRIRAESEKEKLKDQLLQSQKLEAVGILAGGVAHDFNNMLGAIMGYAEITMEEMPPGHHLRNNLASILDAARRSVGLTRQLLTFARKQDVVPTAFDVNESVKTTLKMLRRLIGENIELVWKPGGKPCTVLMDPTQFDQILANLCVNARDAISDIGKIVVETKTVLLSEDDCVMHEECPPGEYVVVSVTDSGTGMDKETVGHIFEPFYTTKGVGHGTGLGLSTVYGIVKQNRGSIKVYSEPGLGTTFNIYLPLQAVRNKPAPGSAAADIPGSLGETVLIVEDDPIVLQMSTLSLQRLGYSVLSACTPGEAIEIAETEDSEVHMVVTDIVMPEMNGKDLARRLGEIRPGIKCLFMSGYTADIISEEDRKDGKINFIRKPFAIRDFARKIREILDE